MNLRIFSVEFASNYLIASAASADIRGSEVNSSVENDQAVFPTSWMPKSESLRIEAEAIDAIKGGSEHLMIDHDHAVFASPWAVNCYILCIADDAIALNKGPS